MHWPLVLELLVAAGIGSAAIVVIVRVGWRLHGRWKIRRAGPRRLVATRHRLWREPSGEDVRNLRFGPGGAGAVPEPPFRFVQEHLTGSQPCVAVRDARNRLWRVKWGHEARPEAFAVRLAWALGYFAEVTHFVTDGVIDDVGDVSRARACLGAHGEFTDARFELEDRRVRMLFDEHSWSWDDNPFVGTPQLSGLKILNMLVSNWDTKDQRDVSRGSNTAIFEHPSSPWTREARYLIADWGGAMGRWGATVISRGRWDVDGFEAQTPQFVTGVADGWINFGYVGQRTGEVARGINVEHGRWFYRYARQLTAPALREALLVCGATEDEADRFARALLDRIRQIGAACTSDVLEYDHPTRVTSDAPRRRTDARQARGHSPAEPGPEGRADGDQSVLSSRRNVRELGLSPSRGLHQEAVDR
jgi:hypothetical protein